MREELKPYLYRLIRILHYLFVAFMILTPFTDNHRLLSNHLMITPMLLLHWLMNSNHCAVTYMERFFLDLTHDQVDESDCVTCQLIDPIYSIGEHELAKVVYVVTVILWFITFSKFYFRYRRTGKKPWIP